MSHQRALTEFTPILAETHNYQPLGADHPATASSLNNLALLYDAMGRYGEAEPLYLRALAIWTQTLPENHPHRQTVWGNFRHLIQQALQQGQAATLSPHP